MSTGFISAINEGTPGDFPEVVAKVIFLHLSVIHSVHGGVCLSACWDTTPQTRHHPPDQTTPGPDTYPPPGPDTPRADTHPPEQTPLEQAPTPHPLGADTHPQADAPRADNHPPDQTPTPWEQTPTP